MYLRRIAGILPPRLDAAHRHNSRTTRLSRRWRTSTAGPLQMLSPRTVGCRHGAVPRRWAAVARHGRQPGPVSSAGARILCRGPYPLPGPVSAASRPPGGSKPRRRAGRGARGRSAAPSGAGGSPRGASHCRLARRSPDSSQDSTEPRGRRPLPRARAGAAPAPGRSESVGRSATGRAVPIRRRANTAAATVVGRRDCGARRVTSARVAESLILAESPSRRVAHFSRVSESPSRSFSLSR